VSTREALISVTHPENLNDIQIKLLSEVSLVLSNTTLLFKRWCGVEKLSMQNVGGMSASMHHSRYILLRAGSD
jgi:hypothetical protein